MQPRLVVIVVILLAIAGGLLARWEINRIDYAQSGLQLVTADSFVLDDVDGKVIYLDFWASWCKPCRESFPWMQEMAQRYHAKGLRIIAVNLDQRESDMQQFLDEFNANFIVVLNPSYSLFRKYKVVGLPTSILFNNSSGNPQQLEKMAGFNWLKAEAVEQQIVQLLEIG